ncbi:polyprenyl synthetase family protein [Bacillus atrophaeus]|uniref:polyprenyl synthetase family protein n=1 Tax=Bacillus atrophaeus TaxID=1452 RepID=UPI00227E0B11|nr:polyprenyl synthetase family protein [Bacillus atrophaeus]MCY8808809.1 polyprenyl synthetase family protein [Bacillus atrophaeus]MCY8921818.1 polyprenyl synthetase family protein [Bacillus atrophaeus]MCY9205337.1 polyprenyl synthetase family protein [Bacillus atrophaeus]MEC0883718.1 polyprenyl synthetase family protein [Bacillus atrophaeus]
MKEIVDENILNEDLKAKLISFIEEKKQFSFAELAYNHYIAFDGKNDETIELLASGIELLILSADIFDDIEDKDNLQASWMKLDPSIVTNAATALYTLSLQVISSVSNDPKLLSLTLQYSLQSLQGQHVDLTLTASSESDYIEMIKRKSGSLITLPSVLGVYLATGEFNETVDEYSRYLGIVEQIANDHQGLYYPDNNDLKTRHTLAFHYLKNKYNQSSIDLLNFYAQENNMINNMEDLKKELRKSGVIQYLNVIKNLALENFKKTFNKLRVEEQRKNKLFAQLLRGNII